jgi:hypothetical protein
LAELLLEVSIGSGMGINLRIDGDVDILYVMIEESKCAFNESDVPPEDYMQGQGRTAFAFQDARIGGWETQLGNLSQHQRMTPIEAAEIAKSMTCVASTARVHEPQPVERTAIAYRGGSSPSACRRWAEGTGAQA